jgi:hypothetical protein
LSHSDETESPDPRFPGGNYLDWLMHLDPLELSAQNIDQIIAAHRAARAAQAGGAKAKRLASPAHIDINSLGLGSKPSAEIKRRKL